METTHDPGTMTADERRDEVIGSLARVLVLVESASGDKSGSTGAVAEMYGIALRPEERQESPRTWPLGASWHCV